jgi:hypothetical protein
VTAVTAAPPLLPDASVVPVRMYDDRPIKGELRRRLSELKHW